MLWLGRTGTNLHHGDSAAGYRGYLFCNLLLIAAEASCMGRAINAPPLGLIDQVMAQGRARRAPDGRQAWTELASGINHGTKQGSNIDAPDHRDMQNLGNHRDQGQQSSWTWPGRPWRQTGSGSVPLSHPAQHLGFTQPAAEKSSSARP